MNTQFATRLTRDAAGFIQRNKTISAASVWNIHRMKRSRIQRRFAL